MLIFNTSATSIVFYSLCAILLVLFIVGWILYLGVLCYEKTTKRKKIDLPFTASELARANLDKAGLTNVEVKISSMKKGFNVKHNTIFVSKKMEKKLSTYSVARVMQYVSLAISYNLGINKGKKSGTFFQGFSSGFLFIATIFSIVIQCVARTNGVKWFTYTIFALAIIFYIWAIFNSKKNKSTLMKANENALVFVENLAIFDENDIKSIKKLYRNDERKIMIERTISVMFVMYFIFKLIGTLLKSRK